MEYSVPVDALEVRLFSSVIVQFVARQIALTSIAYKDRWVYVDQGLDQPFVLLQAWVYTLSSVHSVGIADILAKVGR